MNRGRSRRRRGFAAIEVACGSVFLCALFMVALNITLMILGYQLNDRACRAACRAAAQNATLAKSKGAAMAALQLHRGDGLIVSDPKLVADPSGFVYNDFNGNPYGGNPTVSVTTEVRVWVPAPVLFFGQYFGTSDGSMVSNNWTFRKRYTYPIIDFPLVLP